MMPSSRVIERPSRHRGPYKRYLTKTQVDPIPRTSHSLKRFKDNIVDDQQDQLLLQQDDEERGRGGRDAECGEADIESAILSDCNSVLVNDEHGTEKFEEDIIMSDDEDSIWLNCGRYVEHGTGQFEGDIMSDDEDLNSILSTDSYEDDVNDEGADPNHHGGVPPEDNEPLIPGSDVTKSQSLLLLLAFSLKHCLSKECMKDLLDLLNTFFPGVFPASNYLFFKNFTDYKEVVKIHFYCRRCLAYIQEKDHCAGITSCPDCGESFMPDVKKGHFFLSLSIKQQIKHILEVESLGENLIDRNLIEGDDLKDVTFGQQYRQLCQNARFGPNDLTIQWNCDGAPVFKSSDYAIWPLHCLINELPAKLRTQHRFLATLWFGNLKPRADTYLKAFVDEMEHLGVEGFTWSDGNIMKRSRVVTAVCIADTICRPIIRNCVQFNGEYGCDWCYHPGSVTKRGRGHTRAYQQEVHEMRDAVTHQEHSFQALDRNERVFGVNGPSPLMLLPKFDIILGFAPDYMHAVLLGVYKQFVQLWMSSNNHQSPWYIGKSLGVLDRRLLSICPPSEITRRPRSLRMRKFYKANEWRSFLLYYSSVILEGVLPTQYKRHWDLLVAAMHSLLQDNIKYEEIDRAEAQIQQFTRKAVVLYGLEHMTFNVHQLEHLPGCVRRWGPLWATSGFVFEAQNGVLLKFYKGTQYVPQQIYDHYVLKQSLRDAESKKTMLGASQSVEMMFSKLTTNKKFPRGHVHITKDVVVCGVAKYRELRPSEQLAIETHLGKMVGRKRVQLYNRFIVNNTMYHSTSYSRATKSINTTFQEKTGTLWEINCLVAWKDCEHVGFCNCLQNIVVLAKQLKPLSSSNRIQERYIKLVKKHFIRAFDAKDIIRKAVQMNVAGKMYVAPLPNKLECD
ncbi:uncharacterized protein LOC117100452 [Anneissia japonica]|uniref:uncharacterized protein LOC117100452 n=1 Tax=Anneissia japonica TaxID=1529436 RepID=UPI0014256940|nr:uncharacterized protein LOC117100452 [Anneissia japonica]